MTSDRLCYHRILMSDMIAKSENVININLLPSSSMDPVTSDIKESLFKIITHLFHFTSTCLQKKHTL